MRYFTISPITDTDSRGVGVEEEGEVLYIVILAFSGYIHFYIWWAVTCDCAFFQKWNFCILLFLFDFKLCLSVCLSLSICLSVAVCLSVCLSVSLSL